MPPIEVQNNLRWQKLPVSGKYFYSEKYINTSARQRLLDPELCNDYKRKIEAAGTATTVCFFFYLKKLNSLIISKY